MILEWFKLLFKHKTVEVNAPAQSKPEPAEAKPAQPPQQPEPKPEPGEAKPVQPPQQPEPEPAEAKPVQPPQQPKPVPKVTHPGTLSMDLPRPYRWAKLTFDSQERLRNWDCPGGLNAWAFRLGGLSYRNYGELFHERIKAVTENIAIFQDVHGRRLLRVYVEHPTFDLGDREWDSYIWYGILPYEGGIDVLMVNGGYSVACIEIYRHLTNGRENIEELLQLI